jgi:transposase InsO family protein
VLSLPGVPAGLAQAGARHRRTRLYRPQTNGKAERFNRTLATEWSYARLYTSNQDRLGALPGWLHHYNYHRPHTALGGRSPMQVLNNVPGNYT